MPDADVPDVNQHNDLLGSLANYTADIIAILGADRTIHYLSPVVERVLGHPPDELVGKNAFDYMHPDDEGRVSRVFTEQLNNPGVNPPLEFRIRHADQSWRNLEVVFNNLLHDPKVRGIVASVRDVSERKRVEEQVRFQAQLLEAVGQAVIATDLHGNVTYWGRCAQGLYGWLAGEMMGHPLGKILVPENQQQQADEIMAELRAGRNWSGEFIVRRRNGTTFPAIVTDTPVRDEQGNLVGIIGVSTDLTGLKKAEKALRASEKLAQRQLSELQTIYDTAPVGLGFVDRELRFASVNESLAEINGLPVAEHIGKTLDEVLPPELASRVEPLCRSVIETGEPVAELELRGHTHAQPGVMREWLVSFYPVEGIAGEVLGVNALVQEITERKEAEEALRKTQELLMGILDNAPLPIYTVSEEGKLGLVNQFFANLVQMRREEVDGCLLEDVFTAEEARQFREINRRVIETETPLVEEEWANAADGLHHYQTIKFPLRDPSGKVEGIGGISIDSTDRKRAEENLRESEDRFRKLYDAAFEGIGIHDGERILDVNQTLADMLGYEKEELVGKPYSSLATPEFIRAVREHVLSGSEEPYEGIVNKKDGGWLDVEVRGREIIYEDRRVRLVSFRDVTERKRAEETLRESEERFRSLIRNIADIITVADINGTISYISQAVEPVLGYRPEELVGKNALELVHPDDLEAAQRRLAEVGSSPGLDRPVEFRLRHKNGSWRHMEASASNLLDDPTVRGIVSTARDITERKQMEERLEYQAFHDPLTDLPNRILFADRLRHALTRAKRGGEKVAVLFVDLYNFKVINDSLGHEAGDQLLQAVAERLRTSLRPEDTLARFGGDEFTMLVEDVTGPSDVARLADRVIEEFRKPFSLLGREMVIAASIGISLSTGGQDRPEVLLRQADTAMYRTKKREGFTYQIYDPSMYDQAVKRLELESELRRAVEREEFMVHYQPIVNLHRGKPVAVEALVRWEHPERGLVSPAEFITIAEETGLIVPIGLCVMKEACRQTRAWQSEHPSIPLLTVNVNLSLKQTQWPNLVENVTRILQETGLKPSCLSLEITESVAMEDEETTIAVFQRLRNLGVRLAMDDFGVGHSSLTYLIKRFRMDALKIDRSFVHELTGNSENKTILSGITSLAQALGSKVIVEGIETAEQLYHLREIGCDMGQGYYLARPLPSEAAGALLARDSLP